MFDKANVKLPAHRALGSQGWFECLAFRVNLQTFRVLDVSRWRNALERLRSSDAVNLKDKSENLLSEFPGSVQSVLLHLNALAELLAQFVCDA